jgi:hypothetical protein
MVTKIALREMSILSGKASSLDLRSMLTEFTSRKCKMVYRRSVSVIMQHLPELPDQPAAENLQTQGIFDSQPGDFPGVKPPKRRRPHDEEEEMALFRRVRIKTVLQRNYYRAEATRIWKKSLYWGESAFAASPSPALSTTNLPTRYYCGDCGSSYAREGDLKRHERYHPPKYRTFHCSQPGCERKGRKGFYRREKLRIHERRVHSLFL